MLKGLGKALQDVLDGKEAEQPSVPSSSPLLNAQRRRIYEYLCLRPFITGGRIASDLGFSPSSVSWHLRSLVSEDFVVCKEGARTYHPKDLVDAQDGRLFTILHGPKRSAALRIIFDSPGISQGELSETMKIGRQTTGNIGSELERLGLVIKVRDGKFARWYPTDLLREKQEAQQVRTRKFVEWLLKKLEDGRQFPQVLRRTDTEIQLRIGRGQGKGVLSIPLDPYGALII